MTKIERRITALKQMTVERGCTPAEAAVAARKLAALEAKRPPEEPWERELREAFADLRAAVAEWASS